MKPSAPMKEPLGVFESVVILVRIEPQKSFKRGKSARI